MTHHHARISPAHSDGLLPRIRLCLGLLMAGLVASGLTAFPLVRETEWLVHLSTYHHFLPTLAAWLARVHVGLAATDLRYPFLAYGTDWLAFAHLVLAILFVGPFRDPVRNRWIVSFGLIACAGVLPLALIAGPLRGIPLFWRLIDCSFGVAGGVLLLLCRHYIILLERAGEVAQEQRRTRRLWRKTARRSHPSVPRSKL